MSPNCHALAVFVRELERHSPLTDEDRRAVGDLPVRVRKLDPHSFLIREGDIPKHCCVLLEGYAFRQKVTGAGSRQIMAVCIPGDAIDLQNVFLEVSDHAVQVLTVATIADIPREAIQQLVLHRPAVGSAMIRLTLVEASILREWVVNVGRRDARSRIAHILCEFAVRLEARGQPINTGFQLPMTQEQLADATGLTAVHVNRVLRSLQADGLINRERRNIHIPDWRALQRVGDFSRRYLHISAEDEVVFA